MHLRPVANPSDDSQSESWDGVTRPNGHGGANRQLTDLLVELNLVSRDKVEDATSAARAAGTTAEEVLLERGDLTPDALSRAVAERHGLDHLDLSSFKVDMAAANLISTGSARRYVALPVAFVDERTLLVAMAEPGNVRAVDDMAIMTGYEIRPAVASREDIESVVGRLTQLDDVVMESAVDQDSDDPTSAPAEIVDLRESADDAPVIKLVNQIVAQAVDRGASDVHLEPDGTQLRVRFRIDGVLLETANVPKRMVAGVISRVKIMADLDIAERRRPQDGRVGLTIDSHHVDLRVVTLPSVHGESVVMRILDKDSVVLELDKLGMYDAERDRFRKAFGQSFGAVLVTGPTGSGKSTSLYAALGELNTIEKNIITIEDPVEYQLQGITQVQVNTKAGLTFAAGLRSMMRADPDIIMVGEIRDRETAQIAVEAALTGHLVLSTLHTNDAPTAITRLIEMGVEPFLVASSIDCVVAQRLARTLCNHCKRETVLTVEVLRDHGFHVESDVQAYEPAGCTRCGSSGYKGRIGLYEVMLLTEEIRALAITRAPADQIAEVAAREGMQRLREDGLQKVRDGLTSIAEVARVTGSGSN
jgi:type IV pilus assembly protein PilB